ncbi:hypothetical protein S2091_3869 [Solimicrobium silvestre]|uniref:Uncharacterized protein n=1 Tax=Solimicrobium silvestre TaxID=2099400 RepID=A0A2S9GUR5_9BURK|nr:hypothetical protein S2091_3869 [Solimicrobium silvestre]
MKLKFISLLFAVLALMITPVTNAQVRIGVGIGVNTCGYPALYQACPYYAPPVGVYVGGGYWGVHRGNGPRGHDRGHSDGRGRR